MSKQTLSKTKYERIREKEIVLILREEYARTKRILKKRFKGMHFSSLKFFWYKRKNNRGGECWYKNRYIALNRRYRNGDWSVEQMRRTIRHEMVHLIERGHGKSFLDALELVEGSRYTGNPAYQNQKPKK